MTKSLDIFGQKLARQIRIARLLGLDGGMAQTAVSALLDALVADGATVVHLIPDVDYAMRQGSEFYLQSGEQTEFICPVVLPQRQARLPITARAIQAQQEHAQRLGIKARYLFFGGQLRSDLNLPALAEATMILVDAQDVYDLVANNLHANANDPVVTVAELLDGWPMAHAQSLSNLMTRDSTDGKLLRATYTQWQQQNVPASRWVKATPLVHAAVQSQSEGWATTFVFVN